jgi:phage tail-like protein
MSNVQDLDPFGSYFFALELTHNGGTFEVAHFMECSGIKSTTTVFEIEEGGLNGYTHKRPGQSKWENITLRYATSASTLLLEWRDAYVQDGFLDGERTRWHGAVKVMNNHGDVVRVFEFTNAWPVSWEGPQLSSDGSNLAIESVEIAFDTLRITGG